MDGQKRIRCHQHHRQKQPKLRQRKHRDEQPNADDGQIPELPEPERGFGVQVIRVNVNTITSMNEKSAAAEISAAALGGYSSVCGCAALSSCTRARSTKWVA